jgi:hypothetical protein
MTGTTHVVYYCNQMSTAYRTDERVLRDLIDQNVRCTSADDQLRLVIYYKNKKTRNLLMQNSLSKPSDLQRTNVIYEFSCPTEGCKLLRNVKYVGMTTTTLSRRLTMHLSSGAPKKRMKDEHNVTLTRQILVENTKILKQFHDPSRLAIYEALLVRENSHSINLQDTGCTRTLKLFSGRIH